MDRLTLWCVRAFCIAYVLQFLPTFWRDAWDTLHYMGLR